MNRTLSSRFNDIDFSTPENEIQIENLRFSTFEEEYVDDEINKITNFLHFQIKFQECISLISYLKGSIEIFLFDNDKIIQKFTEYEENYCVYIFNFVFLIRHLTMIYILLEYKYESNENSSYEEFLKKLNLRFKLPIDINEFYNNLINENKIFSKLNEKEIKELKNHIKITFEYEKELLLLEKENYKPGFYPFSAAINYIIMILKYVEEDLEILKKDSKEDNIILFFSDLGRLNIIISFLYLIYNFDENNIFSKEEKSKEWILLKKNFSRKYFYTRGELKKSLKKVFDMVTMGYASFSKSMNHDNNLINLVSSGAYFTYFFFHRKKALIQSKKFFMSPDTKITLTLWNLLDSKPVKKMVKIALPSIKFVQSFVMKRTEPEIKLETILNLTSIIEKYNPNDNIIGNEIEKIFKKEKKEEEEIIKEGIIMKDTELRKDFSELIIPNSYIKSHRKTDDEYIKVKIIHSRHFTYLGRNKGIIKNLLKKKSITKNRKTIMFHIHGGGFVAMTPSSHENYLRKWSNELEIPIFSIYYRLSPEFPFPKALDDCFQSYLWLINYGEEFFKMKINDIILSGDSAGGNLCISLCYLLILKKVKLPKVIFIFYPALKMHNLNFSLSYFNAITDPILNYNLLLFCIKSYLGNFNHPENPFFSPLFMKDNILKFLPSVRIFGGTKDPLRDDGILFYEKLVKLGKDVKYTEFKYFPHGYLNYDFPIMMQEVSKANDMIIQEMEKFISFHKEQ